MDDVLPASSNLVKKKQVECFEDVLDQIGSRGTFQFRLNTFLVFVCAMVSMTSQNHYYALFLQDHWCHVPGRELTNYTLLGWKNLTIPKMNGHYSKCRMFSEKSDDAVDCQHGWKYDDHWLSVTIPSEQNWVCDKELVLSNTLSIMHAAAPLLMCLLCLTGDRFGRRTQFALSVATLFLGRSLSALTPSLYVLFVVTTILGSAGQGTSMECIIAMGMEMTYAGRRNFINTLAMFLSALGKVPCALVAWSSGHYFTIIMTTSLPLILILCFIRWFPESPRWLLAKGRHEEAFDVLRRIAKVNGRDVPPETPEILRRMSRGSGAKVGVASLFKDKDLRRNTLILLLSRFTFGLTVPSLTYNLGNIPANPFVMHLSFVTVEVLSIATTHILIERLGRRLTHGGALAAAAVACFVQVIILTVSSSSVLLAVVTVLLYTLMTSVFVVADLQSLEMHPTSVRQTAIALEMFFLIAPMSVSPYLVYLHSAYDGRFLYGILGILQLVSAVAMSFLPETTNTELPQTLEDARFRKQT